MAADALLYLHCADCRWHGEISAGAAWTCPACGSDAVGFTAIQEDEQASLSPPAFVFSPWQRDQGVAAIIEKLLQRPIHDKRWNPRSRDGTHTHRQARRFSAAVHAYASELGLSREQTIATLASLAIREALRTPLPPIAFDGTDLDPISLDQWARTLRRLINEAVTVDLLGSDWRTQANPVPLRPIDRAEARVREQVEYLLADPQNSLVELEVMRAYLETNGDISLIAERLHRTPEAIRQVFYRLRKKHAG